MARHAHLLGSRPTLAAVALAVAAALPAAGLVAGPAARADAPNEAAAGTGGAGSDAGVAGRPAAPADGAAVYAFACAVCHGATGQGIDEAVLAFPPDYRDCARCHHPQNAPQMPGSEILGSVMAFSLGDPPPLADPERLARFGTVGALYAYVRATMPRWDPGRLDDDAYRAVTEHLLRLAGLLADGDRLPTDGWGARPMP